MLRSPHKGRRRSRPHRDGPLGDAAAAVGVLNPESSLASPSAASPREARQAAQRLLRELAASRQRAEDAEARLERAFAENEQLVRLLMQRQGAHEERERQWAAERERLLLQCQAGSQGGSPYRSADGRGGGAAEELAREREVSAQLRAAAAAAKAEVLRVAQKCAEKMADAAERCEEKQQDCCRLQEELAACRRSCAEQQAAAAAAAAAAARAPALRARERELEAEVAEWRAAAREAADEAAVSRLECERLALLLAEQRGARLRSAPPQLRLEAGRAAAAAATAAARARAAAPAVPGDWSAGSSSTPSIELS